MIHIYTHDMYLYYTCNYIYIQACIWLKCINGSSYIQRFAIYIYIDIEIYTVLDIHLHTMYIKLSLKTGPSAPQFGTPI